MKIKSTYIYTFLIIGMMFSTNIMAQTVNDINQKITIEAENVTISEMLIRIGEKANIKFSYNPKLINANKRINVTAEKKTVRHILDEVFDAKFAYKLRGNYVIIVNKEVNQDGSHIENAIISGYVVDEETLDGISEVSVYTSAGKSIITDEVGFFKIQLKETDNSIIELRKKGYESHSFETNHKSSEQIEIRLEAVKNISVRLERDSLKMIELSSKAKEIKTMFPVNASLKLNNENILDTLYKPFSFSIYPGLATYGNLSGNIVCNFALNFVGYNRGINGVELAALSNINKDDVRGVQLAGLSNYVGGDVSGYQAAGIFNKVGGNLEGTQMAGISNVNFGKIRGLQMAGISNHTYGNVDGLQMAGIFNQSDTIVGGQFGGVINIAKAFRGIQMSGVGNHSENAKGLQLAGVYNQTGNIEGTQISGILNIARSVKGNQIGLINMADSVSGVSIGLFNFIKNGYKRIDFHTDELFPVNLSLRTGVRKFYTIFNGGMQADVYDNESSFYTFGFGIGTSIPLHSRIALDIEATNNHITKWKFTDLISENIKGYLGLEVVVHKRFSIAGGATYNAYYFDKKLLSDPDFDQLRSKYIIDTSDELNKSIIWRSWIGYNVGVRFIL